MSVFYRRWPLSEEPNPAVLTDAVRRRALIGHTHWESRLSAIPDNLPYKQIIKGYIAKMHLYEKEGMGLFIYGPLGTGKTSVGSIILRNALARGGRALSIRCQDMVDELVSRRPLVLPNGAPLIEGLRNVNYLLLDDLIIEDFASKDQSDRRGWLLHKIEAVLRARYDERLPTIITTNMKKQEAFKTSWLKSLLFERYVGVEVKGVNWREDPPPSSRS